MFAWSDRSRGLKVGAIAIIASGLTECAGVNQAMMGRGDPRAHPSGPARHVVRAQERLVRLRRTLAWDGEDRVRFLAAPRSPRRPPWRSGSRPPPRSAGPGG